MAICMSCSRRWGSCWKRITRWQPHVACHLHTCHRLARGIKGWGDLEDHLTYLTRLRRDHVRKHGFWSLVPQEVAPKAPQAEIAQPDLRNTAQVEAVNPGPGDGAVQPGFW